LTPGTQPEVLMPLHHTVTDDTPIEPNRLRPDEEWV
jgi:hypothetical protein